MSSPRSRREFLTTSAIGGLALPAAAAIDTPKPAPPATAPAPSAGAPVLRKRKLGKTGLEVTEVAFGCMITSDHSVIVRNDCRLRIERRFQIRRKSDGETLLRALIHYVCIDLQTGRAKRMPAEFAAYTVAPEVAEALARETEPFQPGVEPR